MVIIVTRSRINCSDVLNNVLKTAGNFRCEMSTRHNGPESNHASASGGTQQLARGCVRANINGLRIRPARSLPLVSVTCQGARLHLISANQCNDAEGVQALPYEWPLHCFPSILVHLALLPRFVLGAMKCPTLLKFRACMDYVRSCHINKGCVGAPALFRYDNNNPWSRRTRGTKGKQKSPNTVPVIIIVIIVQRVAPLQ